MEPVRDHAVTLVDLLDRVLDRGVVLDADIMINLAGIPLLGLKLRLVLAGMETMLRYGMWRDWDEAQRGIAPRTAQSKGATGEIEAQTGDLKSQVDSLLSQWVSQYSQKEVPNEGG